MPKPIEIDFIANDKGVVTTTDKIVASQKKLKGVFSSSIALAGGFGAAVVAGVGMAANAYKEYLDLAKKRPELFTDEQLESAEALADSTDRLKDSWGKFKISVMSDGADGMASAINGLADATDYAVKKADLKRQKLSELREEMSWLEMQTTGYAEAERYAAGITRELTNGVDSATRSYIAWGESMEGVAESSVDVLKITQSLRRSVESYNDKQESLRNKIERTTEKMERMTEAGKAESETYISLQNKLDDYNAALDESTKTFEENTNLRILKRTEEILSANGLTIAEEEALLERGLAMGVYTEEMVAQAKRVISESQRIADAINGIPTSHHTTITQEYIRRGSPYAPADFSGVPFASGTGGWRTVPAGFENDTYPVRLSSGEKFNVIPKGETDNTDRANTASFGTSDTVVSLLEIIADALIANQERQSSVTATIELVPFARALKPILDKENSRAGASLIVGGNIR